jgi:hypothetical protein
MMLVHDVLPFSVPFLRIVAFELVFVLAWVMLYVHGNEGKPLLSEKKKNMSERPPMP